MHSTQICVAVGHHSKQGLLVKLRMNFSYLWCVLQSYLLYSLWLNTINTICSALL